MFLNLLTGEQQLAFARAAVFMVHADGEVDSRETVLLDEIQMETALTEMPPPPTEELVVDDLAVFDSEESKRIFLLELAGVITADGERHADELGPIERWATELGVDVTRIPVFLDLAERAHAVYATGRDLVFGDR